MIKLKASETTNVKGSMCHEGARAGGQGRQLGSYPQDYLSRDAVLLNNLEVQVRDNLFLCKWDAGNLLAFSSCRSQRRGDLSGDVGSFKR